MTQTFDDIPERAVCFKIDRSWTATLTEDEVSEKVRRAWRMSPHRHDPEIAFGVRAGKVIAVLRIEKWTQLPGGRWRFEGERDHQLERGYLGIDVSGLYRGSSNPVRYLNC
jgi:hypothetical protein